MNTKYGQIASILLVLILIFFWSTSILGAEPANSESEAEESAADTTVEAAANATQEATEAAVASIAEDAQLALDLSLIGRTSQRVAAN